jgi:hypothetical protein
MHFVWSTSAFVHCSLSIMNSKWICIYQLSSRVVLVRHGTQMLWWPQLSYDGCGRIKRLRSTCSSVVHAFHRPVLSISLMSSICIICSQKSNWFFMTPSIATKFQYINSLLFSFSLTTCFGPYGPSSGEIYN